MDNATEETMHSVRRRQEDLEEVLKTRKSLEGQFIISISLPDEIVDGRHQVHGTLKYTQRRTQVNLGMIIQNSFWH